jgi:8-oxo-dGTP pyrophosphatase MutT (NUDIX family)
LRPSGSDPEVLLLQRQTIEGDPWSGQISFPGGRSKPGETLLQTAKREAMEEAGIDLDKCELVGRMESVYPGNLSISVTPFVVIAPADIIVKIDHFEIVDNFWTPLSYFSDEKNSAVLTITRPEGSINVPSFVVSGKYVVWGMTLKIMMNLLSEVETQLSD